MVILLAVLAGAAPGADAAPTAAPEAGPSPSHRVLRPDGLHRDGLPTVPGPPAPCVAKAQVFVPWSLCRDLGAPRDGDAPLRLEARAVGQPALPEGTRCALVCTPGARLANWSFLLPRPGYRGRVTCPVSPRVALTLQVGPPHAPPTDGATVQWQRTLEVTTYAVEDTDLLDGDPEDLPTLVFEAERHLTGPAACPAGQPQRPSR